MDFKGLAWLALVLLLAWIVAGLIFKVAGAVIHLLLIAAVILAIVGLIQRTRRPTTHG